MYQVKLCLDGVPMHLWAPDITERIISRTCTLELVEIDLVHPVEAGDMRVNLLWAWTPNPSRIHKRVWVTITRQTRDPLLESITISETPPEHWQQEVKHPVLFHIEEIHDYTAAAVDLRNPKSCRPATRTLPPWHLGVLDGERAPPRLFENFPHHPHPPRTFTFRQGRAEGVEDNTAAFQREARDQGSRTVRDAIGRDGGRRQEEGHRDRRRDDRDDRRGRNRRYNSDHPDDLRHEGRRDDDNDDRDNGGRDVAHGRGGVRGPDVNFKRERTHSPRARDRGDTGRRDGQRHQANCGGKDNGANDRDMGNPPPAVLNPVMMAPARVIQPSLPPRNKGPLLPLRRPRVEKGNEAWSAATIPAARVFTHINEAITAASVEGALQQILVAAGVAVVLDKLTAPPSATPSLLEDQVRPMTPTASLTANDAPTKQLPALSAEYNAVTSLFEAMSVNEQLSPEPLHQATPTPLTPTTMDGDDEVIFESAQVTPTPPCALFKELPPAILSTPQVLIDHAGELQMPNSLADRAGDLQMPTVAAATLGEGRRRSPRLAQ